MEERKDVYTFRYGSKKEAVDDHVNNYRSDGVAKGKGGRLSADFHRVQFLVERTPEKSYVLDVGCNGGTVAIPLKMVKNCYVKGIDIVEELVNKAKKRGVFAEVGEASDLSRFPDNHFDVVICSEVLEHLFNPDVAIGEAKRVLKPGGIYLTTVPNPDSEMAKKLGDYHHQNFSPETIDTLFHLHFKRGSVTFVAIPYSDPYCQANATSEKHYQKLIKHAQWCGLMAVKESDEKQK